MSNGVVGALLVWRKPLHDVQMACSSPPKHVRGQPRQPCSSHVLQHEAYQSHVDNSEAFSSGQPCRGVVLPCSGLRAEAPASSSQSWISNKCPWSGVEASRRMPVLSGQPTAWYFPHQGKPACNSCVELANRESFARRSPNGPMPSTSAGPCSSPPVPKAHRI